MGENYSSNLSLYEQIPEQVKSLNIIPLHPNSKQPLIKWKEYQTKRYENIDFLKQWQGNFAVVCGQTSNNLVVVDVDSEELYEKFKDIETFTVKTPKKGYHLYFYSKVYPERKIKLNTLPVDILGGASYCVIPPSTIDNVSYEVIKNVAILEVEDVLGLVCERLGIKEEQKTTETKKEKQKGEEQREDKQRERKLRELTDAEILEIKEMLKEAYREGNRQNLWMYLSGWGAKAGVKAESIAKILKMLYDEKKDNGDIRQRASAIIHSYSRSNLRVDLQKLGKVLNVDLHLHIPEGGDGKVRGKSGLLEILEEIYSEERALEIIRRLEEIFNTSSPVQGAVFEILNYAKQTFAVANFKRQTIGVAQRVVAKTEKGEIPKIVYKEEVINAVPTHVEVIISPIDQIPKFKAVFVSKTRPKPISLGPVAIDEMCDLLKTHALVKHKRLLEDTLTAVFEAYIRKGLAVVKTEMDADGFFYDDGKFIAVGFDYSLPEPQELRNALEFLDELVQVWFEHLQDKFVECIKWGLIAPFGYVLKQRFNRWLPWLFLTGTSKVGKTTMGEIVLSLYGKGDMVGGSSVNTQARLGKVLSSSTFPLLVNEVVEITNKEDLVEMLKSAIEYPVARGRFVKGVYKEIPSLRCAIFTSNRPLPRDDALLRRFIILTFSYGEKIPDEKVKEFMKVKSNLPVLSAIGRFVAYTISEDINLLQMPYTELSTFLLQRAFEYAGIGVPPSWVELEHKTSLEDVQEELRAQVLSLLMEEINMAYSKYHRTEANVRARVEAVVKKGYIPYIISKGDSVYFLSGVVDKIKWKIKDITSLKSFAELMGWEYQVAKIENKSVKAVKVNLQTLLEEFSLFENIEFYSEGGTAGGEEDLISF